MELYLVKMTHSETSEIFYKVGVSGNTGKRFKYGSKKVTDSDLPFSEQMSRLFNGERYIADHPYDVEKIKVVSFKYEAEALIAEEAILKVVEPIKYTPAIRFSGATECFLDNSDNMDKIIKGLIEYAIHLSKTAEANEPDDLYYSMASYLVKSEREADPNDKITFHLKVIERIKKNYG